MAGRVVPNYVNNFPNTYIQHGLSISIGSFKTDTTTSWAKHFNFPQTGMTLFYSNIGNNSIYGNQFSLIPFVSYKILKNKTKPVYLKLGLGASYFSTSYDSITNPRNVAIGSPFTWAFQAGVYKTIVEKKGFNLKLGVIFSHASNGHTQLPNFGLNSGLVSLSSQFYKQRNQHYQLLKKKTTQNNNNNNTEKHYSINIKQGVGFHEYGITEGPVGTKKRAVYSSSIAFGKTFNPHFKLVAGVNYQFYEQYYNQIKINKYPNYINHPKWSASNLVLYSGVEFLMNHISVDLELGVNVYKPFYKQFETDFEGQAQFKGYEDFKANFIRVISSRLGLNLYLINTSEFPTHNLTLGSHIKGNFGSADFTEFNLGYIYTIK